MPAVPRYIIELIWQQSAALLPEREVNQPLGCHRPRVPAHFQGNTSIFAALS